MIIDMSSKPLLEQLIVATEIEDTAAKALLSALENGVRDSATLATLTNRMTETHNDKMDIWDQLKQAKLDK